MKVNVGQYLHRLRKRFFDRDVLLTMDAKNTRVRTREQRNHNDNGNYKDSRNFATQNEET